MNLKYKYEPYQMGVELIKMVIMDEWVVIKQNKYTNRLEIIQTTTTLSTSK